MLDLRHAANRCRTNDRAMHLVVCRKIITQPMSGIFTTANVRRARDYDASFIGQTAHDSTCEIMEYNVDRVLKAKV